MPIKLLLLEGGVVFFLEGGGSANYILWACGFFRKIEDQ